MKVEFSTDEYERTHGKTPRGRGGWAFCPKSKYNRSDYLDFIFWAPSGTFAEAKKAAKAHYQANPGLLADEDDYIVVCT